jgi:hypothetical protein
MSFETRNYTRTGSFQTTRVGKHRKSFRVHVARTLLESTKGGDFAFEGGENRWRANEHRAPPPRITQRKKVLTSRGKQSTRQGN